MWWLIAGGVVLLYLAASMSRRRKQRLVERTLKAAVRNEIAALYKHNFGSRAAAITAAEAADMGKRYWQSLLELFGASDFPTLMRAMTVNQDKGWAVEKEVVDRLVAMVPGTSEDHLLAATEWSRLDRALSRAGEIATEAGRSSGEV